MGLFCVCICTFLFCICGFRCICALSFSSCICICICPLLLYLYLSSSSVFVFVAPAALRSAQLSLGPSWTSLVVASAACPACGSLFCLYPACGRICCLPLVANQNLQSANCKLNIKVVVQLICGTSIDSIWSFAGIFTSITNAKAVKSWSVTISNIIIFMVRGPKVQTTSQKPCWIILGPKSKFSTKKAKLGGLILSLNEPFKMTCAESKLYFLNVEMGGLV